MRDELAVAKKLMVSPDLAKDELIRLRDSQLSELNGKLDELRDIMKVADDRIAKMKKHEKELVEKVDTLQDKLSAEQTLTTTFRKFYARNVIK